jgi:DNA repair exonuclease SbcCD ATPase subunit
MKFYTLHIFNFLSVGSGSLRLDDRGLLLVQGVNDDDESANSNGAGKSTIADALCWCLYGETARGVSGDAVVNKTQGKNTKVQVGLQEPGTGETYYVTRHRKHGTGKNSLTLTLQNDTTGATTDLTKGTDKLTQAEVDKLVGCTLDVFRAAVYSGQEMLPNLPAMTDKELKLIVEEAAGVNQLQEAYAIASKKFLAQADIVKAAENAVVNITMQRDEAAATYHRLVAEAIRFEDSRKSGMAALEAGIKGLMTTATGLKTKIAASDLPALRGRMLQLNALIDGVAGEQKERDRLTQAYSAAKVHQGKMEAAVNMASDLARRDQVALRDADARLGQPCGECGKSYCAEDLHGAKQLAAAKVKDAVVKVRDAKALLDAATTAVSGAATALETFVRGMTDLTAVRAEQADLSTRIVAAEKLETDYQLTLTRLKADKFNFDQAKTQENPYVKLRDDAENKAALLDERLKKAGEVVAEEKAKIDVLGMAKEVFGPAGVRAHILDTVTPFLNDRTAKYLGSLSDGNISAIWQTLTKNAKGELREKFQIAVTNDKGAEQFAGLSGGEKRKVRLACALALQDLVASRATKPIELWIGDEIDDALDNSGLERLMGILEEKARERGTVIVVSHADLKDWIRNTITVIKKGGYSEIVDGVTV